MLGCSIPLISSSDTIKPTQEVVIQLAITYIWMHHIFDTDDIGMSVSMIIMYTVQTHDI